jgi:pilus assembly protein Flp/PilA
MYATFILARRISPMLKYYIKTTEALKQLRSDTRGVVSFEYIIVAACIIAAVGAVFGGSGATSIKTVLQGGLDKIGDAFAAAVPAVPVAAPGP